MNCSQCNADVSTKNSERPRKGTKNFRGQHYCAACWQASYRLTAAIIPVAEPIGHTWDEFDAVMREMWAATTSCSNWMMTTLYTRDVQRNGEKKMPKMERQYLYPEARRRFPSLPSQTVASLEQSVGGKYRSARYEVVWTAAASLPTFRYPTPFPVHNQSWSIEIDAGKPIASVRLGDARWSLRLKAGPMFKRQMEVVRLLCNEQALPGELALYKDHSGRVLCKMVAWVPRKERGSSAGIMLVRTGITHFLTAQYSADAEDEAWYLNIDDVRRAIREYESRLERLRQDRKAEQRPVPTFATRQEIIVQKQRRRMKSRVQEIAAQLVNYTMRRRAARLEYVDKVRHEESFPWYTLAQRIGQKCNEAGIEFVHHASDDVKNENDEALAKEETQ